MARSRVNSVTDEGPTSIGRPIARDDKNGVRKDIVGIVDDVLVGCSVQVAPEEIAERFAARRGNVREILFDLYDVYERRQSGDASSAGT